MKEYDKANQADDLRNDKMSDLACDRDFLQSSLAEIREVWAGSDGLIPVTPREMYLARLCHQMCEIACNALDKT